MNDQDFSIYAEPLLAQLEDDPNQSLQPAEPNFTTFSGGNDIAGELIPIPEGEPISSVGGNASVSEEDANAARDAYSMAGPDILAFYKSFRFKTQAPFPGKWGVFILDAGVAGLTANLHATSPTLPLQELRQLAIEILLAHERYHFWIDVWALGQEITPLFDTMFKRYVYYLAGKKQTELTPDDHEESLANHYTFQKLKRRTFSDGTTAARLLRQILGEAPEPYCDFAFDAEERAEKEGGLALSVANGRHPAMVFATARLLGIDPSIISASIKPVEKWHPIAGSPRCPVYYVHTSNYAQQVQPFQGPGLPEMQKFITGYLGGKTLGHTDHDYYRIDNGEKVKLPNPHDKNARGYELKGILRKAGMTLNDFRQEQQQTKKWSRNCPRKEIRPPRTGQ